MMNKNRYLLIIFSILIATLLVVYIYRSKVIDQETPGVSSKVKTKVLNKVTAKKESQDPQASIWQGLDGFAFEMSRDICINEGKELISTFDPPAKDIKPGTVIPLDYDSGVLVTPTQAIKWLKRAANSRCSSFKKHNAHKLFYEFALTENNFRSFHYELSKVLEEHRGFGPYKLINKSIQLLDKATAEEAKQLRDGIIFSLNAYINDMANFADATGAITALKEVAAKDMISALSGAQMVELEKEIDQLMKDDVKRGQQIIRKYYPPNIDFSKITIDQIADFYGYEGTREELERERLGYESVRQISKKLHAIFEENFR